MNKKKSKDVDEFFKDSEPLSSGGRPGSAVLRSISPLGMRVLVRVRRETDQTETGLYLPEGAKQSKQESVIGEVLEVASAHDEDTDEEHNISGVPAGALVLIHKDAGVRVPWDEDLRLVETNEVLALVNEVDVI